MKNIEKLDVVLSLLYSNNHLEENAITSHFQSNTELNPDTIDLVLKKLCKDLYVEKTEHKHDEPNWAYSLFPNFPDYNSIYGIYSPYKQRKVEPEFIEVTTVYFNITWEGRIIHELGGYAYLSQEATRQQEEKMRLREFEENSAKLSIVQTALQKQMSRATWILAIAAGIASLYYLVEIVIICYQFFHPDFIREYFPSS